MNAIIDAAINRARTSLLVLAMIVTAGLVARFAIPIASQPDIQVPFFVVTLIHEGISPEDAERLLVMPTEIELRAVEGVKELTSYASEGAGTATWPPATSGGATSWATPGSPRWARTW